MDAQQLRSMSLFASLTDADLAQLAEWTDEIELPAGRVLVAEGALAFDLLIIRSGTADVTVDGELRRTLGPGDIIGEIGLLSPDLRRTATVVATSPIVAAVITGPQFRAIVRDHPQVADRVFETIRSRLS